MIPKTTAVVAAVLSFSFAPLAGASCGSAFCVVNTQWDTQGMAAPPGRLSADLRYDYIEQDQLRQGRHDITAAQDTSDTTEIRTINRNLTAQLDYAVDNHWGGTASLPYFVRDHSHIDDPTGAAAHEAWQFSEPGDLRLLGRYRFDSAAPTDSYGVQLGLKLPTGRHDIANAAGTVAERALQPGTGSTDLLFGAYYAYRPPYRAAGWFAHLLYQRAVATVDAYRPGNQWSLTAGVNYPADEQWTLLLQLNGLMKAHDSGANAEPDLSGGRYLYLTPGARYALTADTQLYGFVQWPLISDVNGVQLVAKQALSFGLSLRF